MFSTLSHLFSSFISACMTLLLGVAHFFVPIPPTCLLTVNTPITEQSISSEGTAHLVDGEAIHITWSSTDAKKATVNDTADGALSGSETFTPSATSTYTYFFESGTQNVTCRVTVQVEKKAPVVATNIPISEKPKPPAIVPPKVPPPVVPPPVVTPPVTPPNKPPTVPIGPTAIAVWNIPLLSGGDVKGNQTVPVSYLQITNVGSASTIVKGFWLTQRGTAPPSAVIGLSTVDDHGGSRGSVGGKEGESPFSSYTALAPADAYFEPGQLRLFTIKAKVTGDTASIIGTGITLEVTSIETTATVGGSLPIRGTTWTIK